MPIIPIPGRTPVVIYSDDLAPAGLYRSPEWQQVFTALGISPIPQNGAFARGAIVDAAGAGAVLAILNAAMAINDGTNYPTEAAAAGALLAFAQAALGGLMPPPGTGLSWIAEQHDPPFVGATVQLAGQSIANATVLEQGSLGSIVAALVTLLPPGVAGIRPTLGFVAGSTVPVIVVDIQSLRGKLTSAVPPPGQLDILSDYLNNAVAPIFQLQTATIGLVVGGPPLPGDLVGDLGGIGLQLTGAIEPTAANALATADPSIGPGNLDFVVSATDAELTTLRTGPAGMEAVAVLNAFPGGGPAAAAASLSALWAWMRPLLPA